MFQDLSRLVHCGSENQTWHQLTAAFSSLSTVRCLVFGPCPPNLIYFAASKMAELESLKAREIVDVGSENSAANNQTPIRLIHIHWVNSYSVGSFIFIRLINIH